MEYDGDQFVLTVNEQAIIDSNKQLVKDKGLSLIDRKFISQKTGKPRMRSLAVYTSGSTGSYIRDPETGDYYSYKVGSKDEDLFFKVILATGECKSRNGFSTLFYASPQHYMSHLNVVVQPELVGKWEEKRINRLRELKEASNTTIRSQMVTVH